MPTYPPHELDRIVGQFLRLRRLVGCIGILLPFALLAVSKFAFQPSLSEHYYSSGTVRNVFVGSLYAVGFFLITYKGHEFVDDLLGTLAGACAFGVAMFPARGHTSTTHLIFAATLFVIFAWFALVAFRKGDPNPTPRKRLRNKVYLACGLVMVVCLLLVVILKFTGSKAVVLGVPWLWLLETVMLLAFGFSWLVKGEALFGDD